MLRSRHRLRSVAAGSALALAVTIGSAVLDADPAAAQPVDRCGSQGTEWVPDRGPGFDFADSCRLHDLCYGFKPYGSSSAGRKACDREFLDNAYGQCSGRGTAGRLWCEDMADHFYLGIRIGGGGPFRRAQPPVGTVTVGEPETVPYDPTVTVGEPEPVRGGGGGGGGGGHAGGGGGFVGGGFSGGGSSGGKTPTVTVGEPETVKE